MWSSLFTVESSLRSTSGYCYYTHARTHARKHARTHARKHKQETCCYHILMVLLTYMYWIKSSRRIIGIKPAVACTWQRPDDIYKRRCVYRQRDSVRPTRKRSTALHRTLMNRLVHSNDGSDESMNDVSIDSFENKFLYRTYIIIN